MKAAGVTLILLLASVNFGSAAYNETLAKYFIWPMAAAAYSDHPETCVIDNFKNAEVCHLYPNFPPKSGLF